MSCSSCTTDILIVGGGLAACILAWKLHRRGSRVHLLYHPDIAAASYVAAGLINPVTGQRLVLQAQADTWLDAAHACYQELSHAFHRPFYFSRPMLRLLRSEKEQHAWKKRQQQAHYAKYLRPHPLLPHALMQQHTGYVDTHALCRTLLNDFTQRQQCTIEHVQYKHIIQHTEYIEYRNIRARHIIFCEGWRGMFNPWFQYLPFQPAKGEILDLHSEHPHPEYMINQGKWLIPVHDGRLRLGATYDTQPPLNEQCSESSKQCLLNALSAMPVQLGQVTVQRQQAGIRPGTRDKHAFIGFHPQHPRIGIFNGFGSKGALLIPHAAESMVYHIQQGRPLPETLNIRRFPCV